MSLKNILKNAKVEPAHILMNLGVGIDLNQRTPGMAAQSWDDMGSNDYI